MRKPKARTAREPESPRVPVHPELDSLPAAERDEELIGTSSSHHPPADQRPEEPADPPSRVDAEP